MIGIKLIEAGVSTDHRSRRVTVLLIGIIILSAADLAITLTYLTSVGLLEANPIAAYLIATTRSPWMLAAYKVLTVGIAVTVLFRLRRCHLGEIAAWCGMAILVCVSLMWGGYTAQFDEPGATLLAQSGIYEDNWLVLRAP